MSNTALIVGGLAAVAVAWYVLGTPGTPAGATHTGAGGTTSGTASGGGFWADPGAGLRTSIPASANKGSFWTNPGASLSAVSGTVAPRPTYAAPTNALNRTLG